MGIGLGILAGLAGQAQGAVEGEQERYKRSQDAATAARQQQQDARQAMLDQSALADNEQRRELNTLAIGQKKSEVAQSGKNRAFEASLKLDPRWSRLKPEEKIAYLQQRMSAAQAVGDDAIVTQTQTEINNISQEATRLASARKSDAQTWEIKYERPREFNSKIIAADRMLTQRLGATKEKYLAEIAARTELAQYSAGARMDIARLVAMTRLQGVSEQDATRVAIAQFNAANANNRSAFVQQENDYRAIMRDSLNDNFGTRYPNGAPASGASIQPTPPININIGQGDPSVAAALAAALAGKGYNPKEAGGNQGGKVNHTEQDILGDIASAFKRGTSNKLTPEKIVEKLHAQGVTDALIQKAVQRGLIPPLNTIGASKETNPLAPLPLTPSFQMRGDTTFPPLLPGGAGGSAPFR